MACKLAELEQIKGTLARISFFDESNGGLASAIIWSGNYIWSDGSNREIAESVFMLHTASLYDVLWVDKNDPREVRVLLSWQKRFAEQKIQDSIREFEQAREELKARCDLAISAGSPSPTKEEAKQVKRLKHVVKQWQKRLDELLEKLNPTPVSEPYIESEESLRRREPNTKLAESIWNELRSLEV